MKIEKSICRKCLERRMHAGHSYEDPEFHGYAVAYDSGHIRFLVQVICRSDGWHTVGRECLVRIPNEEEVFKMIFPDVDAKGMGRRVVPGEFHQLLDEIAEVSCECLEYGEHYLLGIVRGDNIEEPPTR